MTIQSAPLEIDGLITELVGLFHADELNEFRVRQIEVRVRRLLATGAARPADCHIAIAITGHALRNRLQAQDAALSAAALAPRDRTILLNAISILFCIGSNSEGLPLIERMVHAFPDDKEVLESAIIHGQTALHFGMASEFFSRREMLAVNDAPGQWPKIKESIETSRNGARLYGMSDESMCERLITAIRTVRENNFDIARQSRMNLNDGTFISQLYIDANPSVCADLNFKIADALVDHFDDTGSSLFSIVCRPISDSRKATFLNGVK